MALWTRSAWRPRNRPRADVCADDMEGVANVGTESGLVDVEAPKEVVAIGVQGCVAAAAGLGDEVRGNAGEA